MALALRSYAFNGIFLIQSEICEKHTSEEIVYRHAQSSSYRNRTVNKTGAALFVKWSRTNAVIFIYVNTNWGVHFLPWQINVHVITYLHQKHCCLHTCQTAASNLQTGVWFKRVNDWKSHVSNNNYLNTY